MATATTSPAIDPAALLAQVQSTLKSLQANPGLSVTTDVGAVANAIAELAKLAQTPEGQATLKQWRTDAVTAGAWISKAATAVMTWFKGIF